MNIIYDTIRRQYVVGSARYTKEQFIDYIKADILQTVLIQEHSNISAQENEEQPINIDESKRISNGNNILLYGVPGSGKSWTINNEYCNEGDKVERLVFHPDYTYSDFVGQLLPDAEKGIKFEPGPFTRILKEAYKDYTTKYYLIIEELNRGNAPAIFGEIFQLLDRKTELKGENDIYKIGTSEYEITNPNIAKEVYGDEKRKVRIPANLTIIATMNTSDQNVFTLDTAFQRRWDMRMLKSGFENVEEEFANKKILDTTVSWERFCTTINNIILEKNTTMLSSEDKRLGAYFVNSKDLENSNQTKNYKFAEKVLKYLWDDVFKFYREEIFEVGQYNCLEKIIEKFNESIGNERFKIFKENIYQVIIIG